jgi:hypothetical protein
MMNREEVKKLYKEGIYGGAWQPDDSILDEILQAAIQDTIDLLKFR